MREWRCPRLACAPSLSCFYFAPSLARGNEDYCHSVDDINSSSTVMRGQSYILKFLWRRRLLAVFDISGVSLLLLSFSIFSRPELGMLPIFSRSRTKTWIQRRRENFPLMARHKSVSTRHGWNGTWIRGKILLSFLRIFIVTTVQRISRDLFCSMFFRRMSTRLSIFCSGASQKRTISRLVMFAI